MTRPVVTAALAIASLSAMVIAVPVPPQARVPSLAARYGTWTDLDNDCKYSLSAGNLTVSLPAAEHRFCQFPTQIRDNAPRVLSEVEGDFTASAHVVIPVPARAGNGYVAGGLLARHSYNEVLTIRLARWGINGAPERIWGFHAQPTGGSQSDVDLGEPKGAGFLRIQRQGKQVIEAWSRDGKTWTGHQREVAWGTKVKIGVMAESNLGVPVDVVFDLYTLTRAAK
jgi:hypothetical protein